MYRVKFVADDQLPPDVDWAVMRLDNGRRVAFVKQSRVSPEVLAECWAGADRLARIPAQRRRTVSALQPAQTAMQALLPAAVLLTVL